MTSGKTPCCMTELNICQLCGNDMQSCSHQGQSVNYQKEVDPPIPPYSQIFPDQRYEQAIIDEKRRKGKLEAKKAPSPAQVCITLPVTPGKTGTAPEKQSDKNACGKTEETGKKEKDKEAAKTPGTSTAMKASCFPCQGGSQPVKMMLCLPCPPPASVANSSGPGGSTPCPPAKPKDYTYRCESRELRGGNLYSCCQCIKRNGLQHDCPRTPCQGRPACLTKPWPDCWPSGGCHGIDFTREKGTKRYDPCREQRFDKKECSGPGGGGGKADCGGNMMVVVCPPPAGK